MRFNLRWHEDYLLRGPRDPDDAIAGLTLDGDGLFDVELYCGPGEDEVRRMGRHAPDAARRLVQAWAYCVCGCDCPEDDAPWSDGI